MVNWTVEFRYHGVGDTEVTLRLPAGATVNALALITLPQSVVETVASQGPAAASNGTTIVPVIIVGVTELTVGVFVRFRGTLVAWFVKLTAVWSGSKFVPVILNWTTAFCAQTGVADIVPMVIVPTGASVNEFTAAPPSFVMTLTSH